MLRPHVFVVKTSRLLARHREDFPHSLGEVVAVHDALKCGWSLTDRARFLVQRFTHIACARQVRFAFREGPALSRGQVRGLRKNQELVEGIYTESRDQFQSDRQSNPTQ